MNVTTVEADNEPANDEHLVRESRFREAHERCPDNTSDVIQ